MTRTKARQIFLIECQRKGIFPRFIRDKSKIFDSLYQQVHDHAQLIHKTCNKLTKDFLNLEIKLCIYQIKQHQKQSLEISKKLQDQLTEEDLIRLKEYSDDKQTEQHKPEARN